MDSLRNLLQIIDENSQVKEQMKPVEPDYEFMGNPPGDPTYKTDPKTGNLIPDIDPALRPNAPTGPIPGTRPGPGITPPPPAGGTKPTVPNQSINPRSPSIQNRMPSVPPAGQGVKKVTEKTLSEAVDKIIELIKYNDQVVAEKHMGFDKNVAASKQSRQEGMSEEQQNESALQAYLGNKKYGKQGMKALQTAGREGASQKKMDRIRAQHDKMDEQQGLAEESEESSQDQMRREMQSIIDQVKARMRKDDQRFSVPQKPETVEDLKVRIENVKERIADAKATLARDPGAQYADDPRDYRSGYGKPADTLRYASTELAALEKRLASMTGQG